MESKMAAKMNFNVLKLVFNSGRQGVDINA